MTPTAKAAFLDRDGVINADNGYVHRVEQFELLPGVVEALRRLQEAGSLLIVVTNQSGIARGLYGQAEYERVTAHMRQLLGRGGVRLDAVYHCPHLPDAKVDAYRQVCNCRKPAPGMLLQGIARFGVDPAQSVLFGDKRSDIDAGRAAGVGWCCLLGRESADDAGADLVAPDLPRAVDAWLGRP